ncbi:MAG TPA: hypothetical protein VN764_10725 [Polyangiaceae bacterium]|nr:hypothetical protein [Polyangiaceae bacterium]
MADATADNDPPAGRGLARRVRMQPGEPHPRRLRTVGATLRTEWRRRNKR